MSDSNYERYFRSLRAVRSGLERKDVEALLSSRVRPTALRAAGASGMLKTTAALLLILGATILTIREHSTADLTTTSAVNALRVQSGNVTEHSGSDGAALLENRSNRTTQRVQVTSTEVQTQHRTDQSRTSGGPESSTASKLTYEAYGEPTLPESERKNPDEDRGSTGISTLSGRLPTLDPPTVVQGTLPLNTRGLSPLWEDPGFVMGVTTSPANYLEGRCALEHCIGNHLLIGAQIGMRQTQKLSGDAAVSFRDTTIDGSTSTIGTVTPQYTVTPQLVAIVGARYLLNSLELPWNAYAGAGIGTVATALAADFRAGGRYQLGAIWLDAGYEQLLVGGRGTGSVRCGMEWQW